MQLVAPALEEYKVIQASAAIERAVKDLDFTPGGF